MNTVDVDPNGIRHENNEMIAAWPVFVTSQALHHFGEQTEYEDKATIPVQFTAVIAEAKARNRRVRITYRAVLGPQKALDVQII